MKYLETYQLPVDTDLAKRLPASLAYRYHVLPLAEENECVTVAMANPEDAIARREISAYLGSPIYVVKSDRTKIDVRLAEIWPSNQYSEKFSVFICSGRKLKKQNRLNNEKDLHDFHMYVGQICNLLNAQVTQKKISVGSKHVRAELIRTIEDGKYDLVIVNHCSQNVIDRLFSSPPEYLLSNNITSSVLVIHEPCWPLKNILLVLQFDKIDETAVSWAEHLAKLCRATVTILPITPLFPAMYDYAVNEMLSPESVVGKQFHRYIQEFKDLSIPHMIHHHHNLPEQQIMAEIYSRQYQLVIIGAESSQWAKRWLAGGMTKSSLQSANCPILITKNILMQISPQFDYVPEVSSNKNFKTISWTKEKIKKGN